MRASRQVSASVSLLTGLACVFCLQLTAQSAAQPGSLRGRSIILSWQDARTERDTATGQVRNITQTSNIKLYVSTAGRVFDEFLRQSGRASDEQREVSGAGKRFLNWKFEGRSLVADQNFEHGARRVVIDFDRAYMNCSVRVLHGKEGGSNSIMLRSFSRPTQLREILSIKVTGTSCVIQDGNVFGAGHE